MNDTTLAAVGVLVRFAITHIIYTSLQFTIHETHANLVRLNRAFFHLSYPKRFLDH